MVALGENIITDVGFIDRANTNKWVLTWFNVTVDTFGSAIRVRPTGTPAGQSRSLYSAPALAADLMAEGRILRAKLRAVMWPFDSYGDYDVAGQRSAQLGALFWEGAGTSVDIPFPGPADEADWYDPEIPIPYFDVETTAEITAAEVAHNGVFALTVYRGDRWVLVEPGSLYLSIEDPPDEPPTAPTELTVSDPTTSSLSLAWEAATDDDAVDGYNVYLYPAVGGAPTKLNTTLITTLGYTVTDLLPATAYAFAVTAVDTAAQESELSAPAAGVTAGGGGTGPDEPPTAPTNLAAAGVTSTTVALQWDAGTDDVWVIGYNVYVGETKLTTVPQSSLTYTVTGLDPETEYVFTVTSVDTALQESDPSTPLPVTTAATPLDVTPWDAYSALAAELAPTVAAYLGATGDRAAPVTAAAEPAIPIVAEYVRGYTRGRGFDGHTPAPALRAVIVAAAARLVDNPEQVTYFKTGDYSERPATLAGWTLPERAVLHRYRRTTGAAGAAHTDVAAWDDLATLLAPRVADHLGRLADNAARTRAVTIATTAIPIVVEYVRGYTRGRGFDAAQPARPLLAVIVAAAARIVGNPEQVDYYAAGDYSERPATLAGWTLPERAVLNRYRKVTA